MLGRWIRKIRQGNQNDVNKTNKFSNTSLNRFKLSSEHGSLFQESDLDAISESSTGNSSPSPEFTESASASTASTSQMNSAEMLRYRNRYSSTFLKPEIFKTLSLKVYFDIDKLIKAQKTLDFNTQQIQACIDLITRDSANELPGFTFWMLICIKLGVHEVWTKKEFERIQHYWNQLRSSLNDSYPIINQSLKLISKVKKRQFSHIKGKLTNAAFKHYFDEARKIILNEEQTNDLMITKDVKLAGHELYLSWEINNDLSMYKNDAESNPSKVIKFLSVDSVHRNAYFCQVLAHLNFILHQISTKLTILKESLATKPSLVDLTSMQSLNRNQRLMISNGIRNILYSYERNIILLNVLNDLLKQCKQVSNIGILLFEYIQAINSHVKIKDEDMEHGLKNLLCNISNLHFDKYELNQMSTLRYHCEGFMSEFGIPVTMLTES